MPDGPDLHRDVYVAPMRGTLAQRPGARNTGKLALELRAEGGQT